MVILSLMLTSLPSSLVFLKNVIAERAELEKNYAQALQQWVEKQYFILSNEGNDKGTNW